MDGDLLPRIAAFLNQYGIFLLILTAAVVVNVFRVRKYFRRKREIFDPAWTPDWSDRRRMFLREGTAGRWQGREVRLERRSLRQKSYDTIEASVETHASGAFLVESARVGVLRRAIRFGRPSRVVPMNPGDESELRVFAEDRTMADRMLSDAAVRAGLRENLQDGGDELSLRKGRLRVVRHISAGSPAGPAVQAAWKLLKEAARVTG